MEPYADLVLKYNAQEKRGPKGAHNGGKFATNPDSARQKKLSNKVKANARGLNSADNAHSSAPAKSSSSSSSDNWQWNYDVPASHTKTARKHRARVAHKNLTTKKSKVLKRSVRYRIVHGDTLSEIARKYGTTVNALMDANPQIKDRNLIYAGQTLTVPAGPNAHSHGATHHSHAAAHPHVHTNVQVAAEEKANLRAVRSEQRRKASQVQSKQQSVAQSEAVKKSYADLLSAAYGAAELGPYEVLKREFSADQRKKDAESGAAMPGGGFPIENAGDLHNAMQAIGRAKDPEAAKRHIKQRAKALGLEDELTPAFKSMEIAEDMAIVDVLKSLDENKFSLGLAYPANKLDGHKEFMAEDTVEKTAWRWLKDHRQIGIAHLDGSVGHGTVVESYIYRGPDWEVTDASGRTQVIKSGDWLMGAVWDDAAWPLVKSGRFNGWSMQGRAARRVQRLADVTTR